MIHKIKIFILMTLVLMGLIACQKNEQAVMIVMNGETMGTTYSVKYLPEKNNPFSKEELQQGVDAVLEEINRQMSTYREDSEISAFNRALVNETVEISEAFAEVLQEAIRLNVLSEGALDVTIGPLVNLWGFGPDKRILSSPTEEQLNAVSKQIGLDKIVLEHHDGWKLYKKVDGVYLDLSSIAKGYGVDQLAEYLQSKGIAHFLVEIGGEVRTQGFNAAGKVWQLGIEQPQMQQGSAIQVVVPLKDQALATSGDYRNFYTDEQGRRLSHIIDPQTRSPLNHHLASVSVITDTAARADGWATALFVLGEEKALALAEREQLAIFLIIKTEQGFERKMSSEFQKLMTH